MKKHILLMSLILTCASPAFAQMAELDQLRTRALTKAAIAAIDADRNGTIDKQELAVMTNRAFDLADQNRDGQLSEQEMVSFAQTMNSMFAYLQ